MENIQKAISIIANICNLDVNIIQSAYEKPTYDFFSVPKKSGGKRPIHAPKDNTLLVQDRLYEKFFKKLSYHRIMPSNIFGGLKKCSYLDHVNVHAGTIPNFHIAMDFKNAFHCVTEKHLACALHDSFLEEVLLARCRKAFYNKKSIEKVENPFKEDFFNSNWSRCFSLEKEERHRLQGYANSQDMKNYLGRRYSNYETTLFTKRSNKSFHREILNTDQNDELRGLMLILSQVMAKILTCKGIMIQGSPTSQTLMSLMVTYTDLLEKFSESLETERVSIYVDDLSISTNIEDGALIQEKINNLVKEVESNTFWRFNSAKTRIFDLKKEDPILTNVRLKTVRKSDSEGNLVSVLEPTLPKKTQQSIRACLHNAKNSNDEHLNQVAGGYIAFLMSVFGKVEKIPSTIKTQLHKYFDTTDVSFLEKKISKEKPKLLSETEIRELFGKLGRSLWE